MSKDDKGNRCLYDWGWNNGVIILKNCAKVHQLLDILTSEWMPNIFGNLQRMRATAHFDQNMFEFCFTMMPEFKGIVFETPSKSFNSYIPQRALTGNSWTNDDWILHLPRNV